MGRVGYLLHWVLRCSDGRALPFKDASNDPTHAENQIMGAAVGLGYCLKVALC